MRTKNRRAYCMILAIFVFCFGMCFDFVKADSFPACMTALSDEEAFVAHDVPACPQGELTSVPAEIEEVHLCTAEMLGVCRNVTVQKVASRLVGQRQQTVHALDLLSVDICAARPAGSLAGMEALQVCYLYQDERIVQYIQNSDGKKRI